MAKRNSDQKCWQYIRALNSASDERLDSIALFDGKRKYSYRLMFRRWELYAEVFSALDICGEYGSRAALTGIPSAETVIAYYALNMTGTSVSMVHMSDLRDPLRWESMVREEGITDLILADSVIDPGLMERIVRERTALGIRRQAGAGAGSALHGGHGRYHQQRGSERGLRHGSLHECSDEGKG